ncbi:hypothetical protein ACOMHN_035584 [Nucella lapillus]
MVDAGRQVSLNTTSDHALYFVNDLGVNVKDEVLIFDLTSTQDAIIRLSGTQALNGKTCDVIFGSVGNTAIAVRESCGGCGSVIMASGISLDTVTFLTFWMDWSVSSVLKVGRGTSVGASELFTYTWKQQFEINYVLATSYYSNVGQWTFLIDTPPTFLGPKPDGSTVVTLPEDSPISSSLLSLSAEDKEGDVVTFYLIDGQSSMWSIQGADIILAKKLDFEEESSFRVSVVAGDGRNNVTTTFTIRVTDVIDETPIVTSGSVTSVREELALGTEIAGIFSVHDQDEGDILTYSLEGSHKSFFSVNGTTGRITVQQRIDREGGLSRLNDLRVKVVDSTSHSSVLNLDLGVDDVNDNRPQFNSDVYTVNVTSTTPADTPVLTFTVSDADTGKNGHVTLRLLTSQEGVTLLNRDLYINVSKMALSAAHAQSAHTVVVQATDGDVTLSVRLTAVAFVHVLVQFSNDHSPVWVAPLPDAMGQMPDLMVKEDTAVSSPLSCLSARDDDIGTYGVVTYSMTSAVTEHGKNVSDKFFVQPSSGCMRTASNLDRDSTTGGTAYYLLTFRAVDLGSRSAEARLKVMLTDVNDNAPTFSETVYSVKLSCNTQIGSVIASLSASDGDATSNLTFAFRNGDSEYFELNNVTGDVIVMGNVTAMSEVSTSHVLNVSVSDGGVPEMTSSAMVVVQIVGCSATSGGGSVTDSSDLKTTNLILMAACGVLGTGFLLTTVLLIVIKAAQRSLVKPLPKKSADTDGLRKGWSKRTSFNSQQSRVSSPSSDDTVVTDLTDTSSFGSLHFI